MNSLLLSFGTKWHEDRKARVLMAFKKAQNILALCISHFCVLCTVFENNETVADLKTGSIL